jgi:hypothetical protein
MTTKDGILRTDQLNRLQNCPQAIFSKQKLFARRRAAQARLTAAEFAGADVVSIVPRQLLAGGHETAREEGNVRKPRVVRLDEDVLHEHVWLTGMLPYVQGREERRTNVAQTKAL